MSVALSQTAWANTGFVREVERLSGADVSACLQCHKCSGGCPVAPEMDLVSSQVMRGLQLGARELLLGAGSIWLCASCETCSTRCPMQIDVAAVMDTLRIMAAEKQTAVADNRARQFNRAFLLSVKWQARVFELGMMVLYKLFSRDYFSDADKAPGMILKRKLRFRPAYWLGRGEVRRVFRRAAAEEQKR